jgi:hypothetical protein
MAGRDGEIRTRDPLNPIQVRYQAAPRPDREGVSIADPVQGSSAATGARTNADRSDRLDPADRPSESSFCEIGGSARLIRRRTC